MLFQRIATNIGQDDRVIIYPTFGCQTRERDFWEIPVIGTVYEVGDACRRKLRWLELLQRLNKFHPTDEQRELFEQRVQAFIAPTERGKRLALRAGSEIYSLKKATTRSGLFSTTLRLPASATEPPNPSVRIRDRWIYVDVVQSDGEGTGFRGAVHLLESTGLSVISDIDDTMKVTQVTCKRALLENTFLRDFEAVTGMSDVYRRWETQGAAFHYVSSSPWQLFSPLVELFERTRFPRGTFHLRSFGFRDQVFRRLWMLRKRAKISVLNSLLRSFPLRRFVLVGDSGERDPEIYGTLSRRYPDQITGIYIREVPQRPITAERRDKAFRTIDEDRVRVFHEASELPRLLK